MKVVLLAYMIISTTALSRYDFSNQDISKKNEYLKCVKHVKNECKVLTRNHANNLLRTCKLLVIHNHDITQIKNATSCARKAK